MLTKKENPKGLHIKYNIQKVSEDPVDDGAEYFVLRLEKEKFK